MAHREKFTEDYEFEVIASKCTVDGVPKHSYSVSLPHQCDAWEIIGADGDDSIEHDSGYPACPYSKELAVAQMELFVKRAQEALEKLKNL